MTSGYIRALEMEKAAVRFLPLQVIGRLCGQFPVNIADTVGMNQHGRM